MGGRAHLPGNFFNFQVVAGPRCGDVRRSEVILHMATCDVQSFNGDVRCSKHFLQMALCVVRFTFSIAQRVSENNCVHEGSLVV
jgi:hypothetical protein